MSHTTAYQNFEKVEQYEVYVELVSSNELWSSEDMNYLSQHAADRAYDTFLVFLAREHPGKSYRVQMSTSGAALSQAFHDSVPQPVKFGVTVKLTIYWEENL